jgi:hypothetical protein
MLPVNLTPGTQMSSRPFSRTATDVTARRTYELIDEPVGREYRNLVEAALAEGATGMLTVGAGDMSESGRQVVESLHPHLAGAPLRGPGGSLLRFQLGEASSAVLLSAADRLFAWRRPALPDNLCFFRSDGGPWLVTIAAERLGYIELTQLERVRLAHHAPQLASVLAYQAAHDAVLATFERRLEERVDPLVEELLGYARPLAGSGEGLDSVADALQMWVLSDDDLRVEVALEMIASLRMEVLRQKVTQLRARLDDEGSVPAAVAGNSVLRERWRARRRRLLDGVLIQLGGGSSPLAG